MRIVCARESPNMRALTAVVGGIMSYYLSSQIGEAIGYVLFAGGGFIYMAASDLIPELHKKTCEGHQHPSLFSFWGSAYAVCRTFSVAFREEELV